jgi:hypothetical protein
MELDHKAQEDLYARVASYLKQAFGELAEADPDQPVFVLGLGRIAMRIGASSIGDAGAVVDIWTWIGHGITVTPDIALHLVRKNGQLRFGALGLDSDGDILYDHALLDESVSKDSLARIVRVMAASAEELDDELTMRFK